MERIELRLNYPQSKFLLAKDEFVCIKGTWGCGKSRAALMAANDECENHPGNLYLIIRKEWVDLRDSTLHDWATWIDRPIDGDKNVRYSNGSVLMFRHGDDLNALKNVNLGGALMVQAEEMSEEDFWFLKGRLRRQEGTRQLHLECNYDGKNWIYRLFNEKLLKDGKPFIGGKLITTNTFDNEKNLPPDYISGLMKLPKKLQERYFYGSDADMEGVVWDAFSARHIIDPFYIPNGWKKIYALDHGFTNPTAVLFAAVDYDGRVLIYDEHYESGKPISYHADKIKERNIEDAFRLADPSIFSKNQSREGSIYSIADEYRDNGIVFNPAENNLLAGINRVNEFFLSDKLFIFKNCVNTIREIQNWKWKKLRSTQLQAHNAPDTPMDKDDHAADALRYIIMSRTNAPSLTAKEHVNPESAWGRAEALRKRKEVYAH